MEFKDKEIALENAFFMKQEKEIMDRLKEQKDHQNQKYLLQNVSGIENSSVLENAINLGLSAESFAALSLVPLIRVAWADHICDKLEKETILKYAIEAGLNHQLAAYELLKSWLEKEMNSNLFLAWEEYVYSLKNKLTEAEIIVMKEEIVGRAIKVAKASGGIFGLGSISEEEQKVIDRISEDFEKTF